MKTYRITKANSDWPPVVTGQGSYTRGYTPSPSVNWTSMLLAAGALLVGLALVRMIGGGM